MLELASEIGFCLLLAGLLGLYIGYLLGKDSCNPPQEVTNHH